MIAVNALCGGGAIIGVAYPPALGILAGGYTTGVTSNALKYTFSSGAYENAASLPNALYAMGAVSNLTDAIFYGGRNASSVNQIASYKYNYVANSFAGSSYLGGAKAYTVGAGNQSYGYLFVGYTTVPITNTDKYTYSSNTVASATAFISARYTTAASGNSELGMVFSGYGANYMATTEKYNYSTDFVTSGTSISKARSGLSASGNSEKSVIRGGYTGSVSAVTDLYTYATDATSAQSALSQARIYSGAFSSPEKSITCGGSASGSNVITGRLTTCDTYTFSTDTSVVSSGLNYAVSVPTGTSNSHGGLQ